MFNIIKRRSLYKKGFMVFDQKTGITEVFIPMGKNKFHLRRYKGSSRKPFDRHKTILNYKTFSSYYEKFKGIDRVRKINVRYN